MDVAALLEGVQHYTIHGGRYVRVYYSLPDSPETIQNCQLPIEAFDETLSPGDSILLTMVLQTVMHIRRAPAPASIEVEGRGPGT